MRTFLGIFGRGLVALLPTFLSVYILIRFFQWADNIIHSLLALLLPDSFYIPGMGIVFGVLFIFILGLSLSHYLGNKAHQLLDRLFRQVPLVKSIYIAIQDLTDYFSPEKGAGGDGQVVAVKWPDSGAQAIGLVTRSDLSGLPNGLDREGRVAVFFPMSYQMGGFTLFLPKTWLTPLDMKVETVMRSALTGWIKKK
ncbi:MAG: DUF502 domain-containing protein [Bdellovibrionales bacterium]|nr:DUF502 domain-containing protein [Bdellovibrionales bacterium]